MSKELVLKKNHIEFLLKNIQDIKLHAKINDSLEFEKVIEKNHQTNRFKIKITTEETEKILSSIKAGADFVVSSRRLPGANVLVKQNMFRDVLGRVFRFFVRALFHLNVSDSQNGFKGFTSAASEKIFPRMTIFGWAFDVEILTIARSLGLSIKEVPVIWRDDRRSKVNLWGMFDMLFSLFKIKWNLWMGVYTIK